jgi:hypothetical protein
MAAHQCNIHVYTPIVNEPMHPGALRRHHIGIFLRLHPSFFLGGQIGTWIPRRLLSKLGAMGRRDEFGWLFKNERFGFGALSRSFSFS